MEDLAIDQAEKGWVPTFELSAKDVFASDLVFDWCAKFKAAHCVGGSWDCAASEVKYRSAIGIASRMHTYPDRKVPD